MKITTVHYQKLASLGNYENERVGAWAEVEEGEAPEAALEGLRTWVEAQAEQRGAAREELAELHHDIARARHQLQTVQAQHEEAKGRYERARKWLESLGLELPARFAADGEPPF